MSISAVEFDPKQLVPLAHADDVISVEIPVMRAKLSAGVVGAQFEPEPGTHGRIALDGDWLRAEGLFAENLFAIYVRGESMEPEISAGDIVIVNTADKRPIDGMIYAINHGGEAVIKRLGRMGSMWRMESTNPRYKPEAFNPGETPIVGRVVEHRRRYRSK